MQIPPEMLVSVSASTPVCAPIRYHTTLFISGKKKYPATSQLAQLAQIDITYLKLIFLCRSKTVLRKLRCPAMATTIFRSDKEERRELTELAKYLHSAIFYPGKYKEMCLDRYTVSVSELVLGRKKLYQNNLI